MPASKLRRFHLAGFAATAWTSVMGAVIPPDRALVVSKVTVTNSSAANVTFSLGISNTVGNGGKFADNIVLGPGEVYPETGLVVLAGEQINVWCSPSANVAVSVFGQEVDN